MTAVTRINKLHKIIIKRAQDNLRAEIDQSFGSAAAFAANDPVAIRGTTAPKMLTEVKDALYKSRVRDAEEKALQAFLDKHDPEPKIISLDQYLKPRMVNIGAGNKPVAAGTKDHAAILLPDFGLMYSHAPVDVSNWQAGIDAGKKCRLLGYDDWQLWSDKEAELIIDRDFRDPAVDPAHFANTPTDRLWWTRAELKSSSGLAFCVGFGYGGISWDDRGYDGRARFVRRVPASQLIGLLAA
eukprot:TRINITY_DN14866_c0_g1_i13.p2 TRINITY_DN14866_c0_g1~~TRINITY_DN14866_c0_g1_i13.p2  ORF type:complete len:241 (+),score=63.95 TRINITY_DN14866_c0_g1_i13:1273-1995(+)